MLKLSELIIQNFRGVGEPVRIKIDNIIVLIGNNNVGKTTILSAYEAFATNAFKLTKKDFFNETESNTPVITGIFTNVSSPTIAEKWIHNDEELCYENCIKIQYRWSTFDGPKKKYSYDPEIGDYVEHGTGGFDSILLSKIPTPIKISPLDNSSELEKKILSILTETIKSNVKHGDSRIRSLLDQIEALGAEYKSEIQDDLNESTRKIAEDLSKIFPGLDHIELDVQSGKIEPEKLIGTGSFIRIGSKPIEGGEEPHHVPLSHHGTGLQRTFLWSALKMLAETGRHKVGSTVIGTGKPKILLIEEPEAFLHPNAIREARDALYAIADLENWQVMTTTHSPMFIDLTKDHTTIIRIEKDDHTNRVVKTFSTEKAGFNANDKENLKMMNYCNPYINEFFFAKQTLLVEGETEYSVVRSLIQNQKVDPNLHILNCIGKGNIVTVSKILNHFSVPYSILHDSDNPTTMRKQSKVRNGAWTNNHLISDEVDEGRKSGLLIKTFVSIPNFEGEFLEGHTGSSKPYEAWKHFQEDNPNSQKFISLLDYITERTPGTSHELEYHCINDIQTRIANYIDSNNLHDHPNWDLNHYYSIT